MSSKFRPNTSQVPNVIFDTLMAGLSNNELRVLLAIVRKTYGWHKDTDKISNSQFEDMTGVEKRQIQRAKASLKAKGLIDEIDGERLEDISEYSFVEPSPVSAVTPPHVNDDAPPHDIGDTGGVSSVTPTKDTNKKRHSTKKQVINDPAIQSEVNSFLKKIQESTGMILYSDYRLRNIIKKALASEGKEYLSDVLANYLNDEFMKAKRAWSFTGFFSSKEKMERHKSRKAKESSTVSTLPVFGAGEKWYA